MSKPILGGLLALSLVLSLAGCGKKPAEPAPANDAPAQPAAAAMLSGKVLETMDSGGYTYARLGGAGDAEIWVAGPPAQIAVGDTVFIPADPMAMKDFHSTTLDRTFDVIYFAGAIAKAGEDGKPPQFVAPEKPAMPQPSAGPPVAAGEVAKAADGMTIAEIRAGKDKLAGASVTVRGKVTKVNASVMGKNWLHMGDGSGDEKTGDLTVTTAGELPAVGDTVLVTGKLAVNQDFGFGYQYDVLVEDAEVRKE